MKYMDGLLLLNKTAIKIRKHTHTHTETKKKLLDILKATFANGFDAPVLDDEKDETGLYSEKESAELPNPLTCGFVTYYKSLHIQIHLRSYL